MCNYNGALVQGLNDQTRFIKTFQYSGINAYWSFPLTWTNDEESKTLTREQQSKEIETSSYISLEFISNSDLYERYINKCKRLNLDFRVLFVESDYKNEIWSENIPELSFLGYEYCSIPIDEQIITDMDWYEPFKSHVNNLNENGLFKTRRDVEKFVEEYEAAFHEGKVGDGEVNNYICKVYEVIL